MRAEQWREPGPGSDLANKAFDTRGLLEMVSPSSLISHLLCRVSLL